MKKHREKKDGTDLNAVNDCNADASVHKGKMCIDILVKYGTIK